MFFRHSQKFYFDTKKRLNFFSKHDISGIQTFIIYNTLGYLNFYPHRPGFLMLNICAINPEFIDFHGVYCMCLCSLGADFITGHYKYENFSRGLQFYDYCFTGVLLSTLKCEPSQILFYLFSHNCSPNSLLNHILTNV